MKKLLTLSFLIFHFSFLASYAQNDIWIDINGTADSIDIANQARPFPGSNRIGNNPVLFLVGNSTMRTGTLGNGNNGQWGWGFYAHEYYDENKITVENHALGGTSPRTFYTLLWKPVLEAVRKGDYVFLELGHNDNGPIDSIRARSSYRPDGKLEVREDSISIYNKVTKQQETVYTFGGYMRRFMCVPKVLRLSSSPSRLATTTSLIIPSASSVNSLISRLPSLLSARRPTHPSSTSMTSLPPSWSSMALGRPTTTSTSIKSTHPLMVPA